MHYTMTLTGADDTFSFYSTDYGELRIRDVTLRQGVLPQYLDLPGLWEALTLAAGQSAVPADALQDLFLQYAGALGATESITRCASCSVPHWSSDLQYTDDGECCEDCISRMYRECPDCSTLTATGRVTNTSAEPVCPACIEAAYSHCEVCDEWFHEEDDHDFDHYYDNDEEDEDMSACCSSPQLTFRVRNGTAQLSNDTRAEILLPSQVSLEGLALIQSLLRQESRDLPFYNLSYSIRDTDALSPDWQTRQGNFPKRLSKLAYEQYRLKLPPELLAKIGTIAREHSQEGTLSIEVTRDLNLPSYLFANDGSCWWNSYSESRCALKTNGGFGLRSFAGENVTGRAWVLPLRASSETPSDLTPTFNTEEPGALVVFNGYGALSGYNGARVMAAMTGWTYARIDFECAPMYVNAGGYLIAPEETAQRVKSVSLSVRRHSSLYDREAAASAASAREEL